MRKVLNTYGGTLVVATVFVFAVMLLMAFAHMDISMASPFAWEAKYRENTSALIIVIVSLGTMLATMEMFDALRKENPSKGRVMLGWVQAGLMWILLCGLVSMAQNVFITLDWSSFHPQVWTQEKRTTTGVLMVASAVISVFMMITHSEDDIEKTA